MHGNINSRYLLRFDEGHPPSEHKYDPRLADCVWTLKTSQRMGVTHNSFDSSFETWFFPCDITHQANIFIFSNPQTLGQYVALEFGNWGLYQTLKKHWHIEFLAFINREYREFAQLY